MNQPQPVAGHFRQLLGLDLLRFVAALLVMLLHYGCAFGAFRYPWPWLWYKPLPPDPGLADTAWVGFVGVQIFFVLSGFVIAYSAQRTTAGEFLRARFTRLYPGAWICATFTALLLLLDRQPLASFAHSYLNSLWISPFSPWIDPVYWTLGIELSFYLVIFLLLLIRRYDLIGKVMSVIGIVSTAAILYAVGNLQHWFHIPHLGGRYAHQLFNVRAAGLLLLPFGAFFAVGTMLWLCLFDRASKARIAVAVTCFLACLIEIRQEAAWLTDGYPTRAWVAAPAIWALAVVGIIVSVRWNAMFHSRVGIRGARIIRRLGLVTYPVYLIHQFCGYLIIVHLHGRIPYRISCVIAALASLAAAWAINRFAEGPIQRWVRNWFPSPKLTPAPAATLP